MRVQSVLETCLYVDDLEAAERFYTAVFGLELHAKEPGRHVFLRCGQAMFLLFNPIATESPSSGLGVPAHGSRGPGHAAFRVAESELPAWRSHLVANGIPIETEVTWPNGGKSVYFRDPAGNSLELATPDLWGLT